MLGLWTAIFGMISLVVLRRKSPSRQASQVLNAVGLVLVLMPIISIANFYVKARADSDPRATRIPRVRLDPSASAALPDIYYIILDGYARSDYMKNEIGYDNSELTDYLREEGFYIVEHGHNNHNTTALSLASSLNMTFAQYLGVRMVKGDYPEPFAEPIRHSVIRQALERVGYVSIALRSGYRPTEIVDADIYLSPDEILPGDLSLAGGPNAFEELLVDTTFLRFLDDTGRWDLTRDEGAVEGASTGAR